MADCGCKAMQVLESLTPNGSEYVNDPDACVAAVKAIQQSQHRQIVKVNKENHALHASAKELRTLAYDVAVTYHATALHLHSFDNCDQRLCVRVRAVLASTGDK